MESGETLKVRGPFTWLNLTCALPWIYTNHILYSTHFHISHCWIIFSHSWRKSFLTLSLLSSSSSSSECNAPYCIYFALPLCLIFQRLPSLLSFTCICALRYGTIRYGVVWYGVLVSVRCWLRGTAQHWVILLLKCCHANATRSPWSKLSWVKHSTVQYLLYIQYIPSLPSFAFALSLAIISFERSSHPSIVINIVGGPICFLQICCSDLFLHEWSDLHLIPSLCRSLSSCACMYAYLHECIYIY